MSCKPGSSFRQFYDELGAFNGNRLMILNEFSRFLDEASGKSLIIRSDLKGLAADMKSLAPEDEKIINEFIGCYLAVRGIDTGAPDPKELMGPLDGLKMMWRVRRMIKYAVKYNQYVCGNLCPEV